jgi:hypothetical protein
MATHVGGAYLIESVLGVCSASGQSQKAYIQAEKYFVSFHKILIINLLFYFPNHQLTYKDTHFSIYINNNTKFCPIFFQHLWITAPQQHHKPLPHPSPQTPLTHRKNAPPNSQHLNPKATHIPFFQPSENQSTEPTISFPSLYPLYPPALKKFTTVSNNMGKRTL